LDAVYVEDAGTTLVPTYDPGCNNGFDHVAITQTATTVTLSIIVRSRAVPPPPPSVHGPVSIGCAMNAIEHTTSVHLSSPLGTRHIVDGVTEQEVSPNTPLSAEASVVLAGRSLVPCASTTNVPCWMWSAKHP
jgi:hypothetical protein